MIAKELILSKGDWHKQVPRDLEQNLAWRVQLLKEAEKSRLIQQGLEAICRRDVLFYINSFVWQYNPLLKASLRVGPFVTWPFQDRALLARPPEGKGILWCFENDKTSVIEKSREMGASWLFLIFADWLSMFHNFTESLFISRNADAVDCNSPNSLFWKLRFMHRHLPFWLKGELIEQKMFFEYRKTQSTASGEASTGTAGVGGRASLMFIDEFSKIKEDAAVRSGTASTAECRFFNGTHEGAGTEFFRLTQSPEIIKLQFHWTQHPRKNQGLYSYDKDKGKIRYWKYIEETDQITPLESPEYEYPPDFIFDMTGAPNGGLRPGIRSPWYDKKSKEIGDDRMVAMELDIDPLGSVSQFFEGIRIAELKHRYGRPPVWQGRVEYSHDAKQITFIEEEDGPLRLWRPLRPDGMPAPSVYGIGADISGGTGRTCSCLSIADAMTGEKVAEFSHSRIDPYSFATLTVALCRAFRGEANEGAALCWEDIGPGATFGRRVWESHELCYRNIYCRIDGESFGQARTDKPGWRPNGNAKPLLLRDYKRALYAGEFLNPSVAALDECLMLKYGDRGSIVHSYEESDNPEESRENHADRVIADALANLMIRGKKEKETVPEPTIPVLSFQWRREFHEQRKRREERWA